MRFRDNDSERCYSSGMSKSLSDGANSAARAFAKELVEREFGGNVSAAAKKLGLAQSLVSEFLQGIRGAGMKTLEALSHHTGASIDTIIGRSTAPPNELVVVRDPRYPNLSTAIAFMRGQVKNPEVLETVERRALRSHEDPPPLWWAKKIEALDDDITFEREHPERAAEDEDRADAELRAMEERTTPPIAKQLEAEAEAKKKARKR